MYSVRFHLGRGPHYRMWQVKNLKDKTVEPVYYEPNQIQLHLINCELICHENKARRVHAAGIKDVCGWIKCSDVFLRHLRTDPAVDITNWNRISFNPIVDPNWRINGINGNFNNAVFDHLYTSGRRVYCESITQAA